MLSAMTSGKQSPGPAGRSPRRTPTHGAGLSSQRLGQGAGKQDLRRQVARLLHPGPGEDRELKVFSDEDWKLMTTEPRPPLKCFEPACDQRLSAVDSANRARHLRVRNPEGEREVGCAHIHPLATGGEGDGAGIDTGNGSGNGGVGGGGGLMSDEHRWLQFRIEFLIRNYLKLNAWTEDSTTFADVYVEVPDGDDLAIEVQRWPTDFPTRSQLREDRGASPLWLLTDDAHGRSVNTALREHPCARLYVHHVDDTKRQRPLPLQPWQPHDFHAIVDHHHGRPRTLSNLARLAVGQTIARLGGSASGRRFLTTRNPDGSEVRYDIVQFLREVTSGQRRWHPAGFEGMPIGAWVLQKDLQQLHLSRKEHPHLYRAPGAPGAPGHLAHEPAASALLQPGTAPNPPQTADEPSTPQALNGPYPSDDAVPQGPAHEDVESAGNGQNPTNLGTTWTTTGSDTVTSPATTTSPHTDKGDTDRGDTSTTDAPFIPARQADESPATMGHPAPGILDRFGSWLRRNFSRRR